MFIVTIYAADGTLQGKGIDTTLEQAERNAVVRAGFNVEQRLPQGYTIEVEEVVTWGLT